MSLYIIEGSSHYFYPDLTIQSDNEMPLAPIWPVLLYRRTPELLIRKISYKRQHLTRYS